MARSSPTVHVADHDGDAAVEVDAEDEAAALRGAVQGLATLLGVDRAAAGGVPPRTLRVDGADAVSRLVGLLDALIALLDTDGMVAADAAVHLDGAAVEAKVRLVPVDPAEVAAPPKAATWHGALSEPVGRGWRARAIIDR